MAQSISLNVSLCLEIELEDLLAELGIAEEEWAGLDDGTQWYVLASVATCEAVVRQSVRPHEGAEGGIMRLREYSEPWGDVDSAPYGRASLDDCERMRRRADALLAGRPLPPLRAKAAAGARADA